MKDIDGVDISVAADRVRVAGWYQSMGWTVIPLKPRSKLPSCRSWKKIEDRQAKVLSAGGLFRPARVGGVGVVFGASSGGLAARDFDEVGGYQQWAEEHPELARSLPTVKTARGYHVYFVNASPLRGIKYLADGELRLSGCYCVLPPSVHPDGAVYEWAIEPVTPFPRLDPRKCGLLSVEAPRTERAERTEHSERAEQSKREGKKRVSAGSRMENAREDFSALSADENAQLIQFSLPTGPGQRHRKLFSYQRHLKARLPEDTPVEDTKPYIKQWHGAALPHIRTKPFAESWGEALLGWGRIRSVPGEHPVQAAFEESKVMPDIEGLDDFADETEMQTVAKICCLLQGPSDCPFYLSTHSVEKFTGIDHCVVYRRLKVLAAEQFIECVDPGSAKHRKAARFRWIKDRDRRDRANDSDSHKWT